MFFLHQTNKFSVFERSGTRLVATKLLKREPLSLTVLCPDSLAQVGVSSSQTREKLVAIAKINFITGATVRLKAVLGAHQ